MADNQTDYQILYAERLRAIYTALKANASQQALDLLEKNYLMDNNEKSFVAFIDRFIEENGLTRKSILQRADVAPAYGYKLLRGEKHTNNRNIILRLCMAMHMPLSDVQLALQLYGLNPLSSASTRDRVLATGIHYRELIDEVDEWLCALKLEPLMDGRD